ncbi:MAG: biotin/lipoyl-binding protein [Tepidisphaera sp.]|nr:biotin/lipoyl-binding protein [Tepidisphaera sp.]
MPIKVEMPRLSDTMQAGTVVKWNVKPGDTVKSGQAIADIETDKATMELQSFDDGVVAAIPVPEGQSVPIGTVILVLAAAGEDVKAAAASAGTGAAPAAAPSKAAAGGQTAASTPSSGGTATLAPESNGHHGAAEQAGGRVFASPLAKKIAEEAGVSLQGLHGTGPSGRIIRKDVEQAIAGGAKMAPAAGGAAAAPQRMAPAPLPPAGASLEAKRVTLSNMRRVIAQRLSESKSTIPHYQVTVDIDMDALLALRAQLNEQLSTQGVKLSVNDFIVRACALGMHEHPYVNSRWVGTPGQEAIEIIGQVNIGIAIALSEEKGGGLLVATIRNADQIGLRQISAQSKQLAEKARGKGLSPQEMSDSTFTISNLGMFGVAHFNAIINPPNVAILAVGAALDRAVVRDGKVVPGKVMSITMSSDHRVVDGAMAAAYLATVKNLLEKPATLLV